MTDDLLILACQLAEDAGKELLSRFGDIHTVDTKSSATDPVSEADKAAEALLVERIAAARPHDGILGEEGADRDGTSGLRWVLDPLDGTVNYLYGRDEWVVSIAVEDGQGITVGAVRHVRGGLTYGAERDHGAWAMGSAAEDVGRRRRLSVNDPVPMQQALVGTGFSYDAQRRARQGEQASVLLPRVRDLRRGGSCALDLCHVASGQLDGFYETGVNYWDWAAGALIAAEAGAEVTRYEALGAGGLVVSGRALHDALVQAVT